MDRYDVRFLQSCGYPRFTPESLLKARAYREFWTKEFESDRRASLCDPAPPGHPPSQPKRCVRC